MYLNYDQETLSPPTDLAQTIRRYTRAARVIANTKQPTASRKPGYPAYWEEDRERTWGVVRGPELELEK